MALTRILLLASAAGIAGVLMWGYIADRYMADFMPFLIVAGAIGMIELWRRILNRGHRWHQFALGGITVLAVFGLVANIGIALEPTPQFTSYQLAQFVRAQQSLSVQSLASTVHHAATLPYWAPAGQLYAIGDCSGLYYSTGDSLKYVPGQQIMHWTWVPVEQDRGIVHTIDVTVNESTIPQPVPVLTYGPTTLYLEQGAINTVRLQVVNAGDPSITFPPPIGAQIGALRNYQFQVTTDPNMHFIEVSENGSTVLTHYLAGSGPARVVATPSTVRSPIVVSDATGPGRQIGLCRSLLRGT
jgi:hypothetical protein